MAGSVPPSSAEQPFHIMVKPAGPACNLECEYCYYLDKAALYPERNSFRMSDETLETFIQQYIEAQPSPAVTFAWQGGEPTLLGMEFFERVVELQSKYSSTGVQIQNTLQTNGTRLNAEWAEFLAQNDFLVGISIDGPESLHNTYRQTRDNSGTFKQVMSGLTELQDAGVAYNVLCVVNDVNSHYPSKVYSFFKERGVEWIQFIPLVEPIEQGCSRDVASPDFDAKPGTPHEIPEWVRARGGSARAQDDAFEAILQCSRTAPVSQRSVDPGAYGEFLCTIFDEWIRSDITRLSIQLFDQCIQQSLKGHASLCLFSETCGRQLAMEHNGDVFACDHYVDPGFKRGNIHEEPLETMVDSTEQTQFGDYKQEGLPRRCRACPVGEFCNGGCPKNWLLETPTGEPGLNYLCPGYRTFFTYVQPYMTLIEWVHGRDLPLTTVSNLIKELDSPE